MLRKDFLVFKNDLFKNLAPKNVGVIKLGQKYLVEEKK